MTKARDLADGTFSGDLTVDTDTLYVDSANNNVGIGTSSPDRFTISGGGSVTDGTTLTIDSGSNTNKMPKLELAAYNVSNGNDIGQIIFGHFGGDATADGYGVIAAERESGGGDGAIALTFGTGTSGTERLRILSSGGITFNGDTAPANALDDYEEGTWTPVYDATGTNPTVSHYQQVGRYRKVGNLVTAWFRISTSTVTSQGSGQVRITGLPFTSTSVSELYGSTAIAYASAWNGGNAPSAGYNPPSSTLVYLVRRASADAQDHLDLSVAANDLKTTVGGNDLIGTVIYMTD